ncbi:MAG: ATP synthase F1 subunit epsilon, partial [Verrucomicrobia bacterium]|nr:ATP synthase F1 subunit epsilon [Verrucomicrobiota bacterium]
MSSLMLSIVTPEGKAFEGDVTSVTAPGVEGSFAVLPSHAPMIAALETGVVRVTQHDRQHYFVVDGGFLEVRQNAVVILGDAAIPAEDL